MNPVVIAYTQWEAMLNALVASMAPWNGAKMHLYSNNLTPAPTNVLTDFTECTFTGYAESAAITWGAAAYLPTGQAVVVGDAKTFQVGSTPTILQTVYGWYLTTGTSPLVLVFSRKFDSPVVLSAAGQIITVLPTFPTYLSQ